MTTNTPEAWEERFVEKGADLEHTRWAGWQAHFFAKCEIQNPEDGYVYLKLAADDYERWRRQIETSYTDLSEREKESDRREVRSYLPLIRSLLHTTKVELLRDILLMDFAVDIRGRHFVEVGDIRLLASRHGITKEELNQNGGV